MYEVLFPPHCVLISIALICGIEQLTPLRRGWDFVCAIEQVRCNMDEWTAAVYRFSQTLAKMRMPSEVESQDEDHVGMI